MAFVKQHDPESTVALLKALGAPPPGTRAVFGPGRARVLAEIYAELHGLERVSNPQDAQLILDDEINTGWTYRRLKKACPDTPFWCLIANTVKAHRAILRDEEGKALRDEKGHCLWSDPLVLAPEDKAVILNPPKRELISWLKSLSRDADGATILAYVERRIAARAEKALKNRE